MNKPFRYSTISDAHKCMKYYELKHLFNMDDGLQSSGDIQFGTAIHLAMQDLFEGGNGLDIFSTFWAIQKEKDLEFGRLGWSELQAIGEDLIRIFVAEHMWKFAPDHLEHKMTGTIGKHAFQGTADFIGTFRSSKTSTPALSLVDWKTSAMPYDHYKLQINEQIYGYVHLANQTLGLNIRQGVYAVAVKDPKNPRWQFRTAEITKEKLTKVLGNIENMCEYISTAKQFIRNPSACVVGKRVCPFFQACHGGQDGREEAAGSAGVRNSSAEAGELSMASKIRGDE